MVPEDRGKDRSTGAHIRLDRLEDRFNEALPDLREALATVRGFNERIADALDQVGTKIDDVAKRLEGVERSQHAQALNVGAMTTNIGVLQTQMSALETRLLVLERARDTAAAEERGAKKLLATQTKWARFGWGALKTLITLAIAAAGTVGIQSLF